MLLPVAACLFARFNTTTAGAITGFRFYMAKVRPLPVHGPCRHHDMMT